MAKPAGTIPIRGGGPLSKEDEEAIAWAADRIAESLPNTRKAAQHWQTTISAILGLFGAATIINSDKDIAALLPPWGTRYVIGVVAALILGSCAIILAAIAGEEKQVAISADPRKVAELRNRMLADAAWPLRWSRWLTAFAVVALMIVTGIRWYAPRVAAADVCKVTVGASAVER